MNGWSEAGGAGSDDGTGQREHQNARVDFHALEQGRLAGVQGLIKLIANAARKTPSAQRQVASIRASMRYCRSLLASDVPPNPTQNNPVQDRDGLTNHRGKQQRDSLRLAYSVRQFCD